MEQVFSLLEYVDDGLWEFIGFPAIIILGLWLSWQSGFFQVLKFPKILKTFFVMLKESEADTKGIHPVKALFASIGGCIGIGNLIGVCTAVQIGGPGAVFWIWVTALLGMLIKYGEIYLGMKYRVPNNHGSYDGGPMYFLAKAFPGTIVPQIVSILLCIYGVEIFQFAIVIDSVTQNLAVNKFVAIFGFLSIVMYAASGGVQRVGEICSAIIPFFFVLFIGMGFWIMWQNFGMIPDVFRQIFTEAFTGTAAIGGFAGSSLMLAISQGIRRGCYTGDVGIGYASVIHSESREQRPERQASLGVFGIFLDTFVICTISLLLVLFTGVWKESIPESMLIQAALEPYFPYMHLFMPLFLFLLGYSTIIAYFVVGLKCARFLSPTWGKTIYYTYAAVSLVVFSFVSVSQALIVMSITGACLLVFNLLGIFILRKEISYDL